MVEDHLHHEPIPLGVGQLVDALALDRVLRGDDEERPGHLMGVTADRHLLLGHHLEECRLDLGRSTVDLVGEQEVDEHGAELDVEAFAAAAVDPRADDVGRQQIGGELDTGERAADDIGQRLGGERLGQTGYRFEQDVTAGQSRATSSRSSSRLWPTMTRRISKKIRSTCSAVRTSSIGATS